MHAEELEHDTESSLALSLLAALRDRPLFGAEREEEGLAPAGVGGDDIEKGGSESGLLMPAVISAIPLDVLLCMWNEDEQVYMEI